MHVFVVVFGGFVPLAIIVQKLIVLGDESFSNSTLSTALLVFFSLLIIGTSFLLLLGCQRLASTCSSCECIDNNEFLGRS